LIHRLDEFPAGYSLAGCSPAEPASASPTIASLLSHPIRMLRTSIEWYLCNQWLSHPRGSVQAVRYGVLTQRRGDAEKNAEKTYIMVPVRTIPATPKWLAVFCLMALLFAVLTPGTSGILSDCLVPQWFFFALFCIRRLPMADTTREHPFPFLSALPSRAPPVG